MDIDTLFDRMFRASIGYDALPPFFHRLQIDDISNFPPHNIEKLGDNSYRISLAVAGYKPEDINVAVENGFLTISTVNTPTEDNRVFVHRGIANRKFEKRLQLAEFIEIVGAYMENGLLNIDVVKVIPEEKKLRKIPIKGISAKITADKNLE